MDLSHVRRGATWVATALAVGLTGCGEDTTGPGGGGGGGGGGTPVMTQSVNVADNDFQPGAIQVSPGATVTWTWTGSAQHNVTFSSGGIASSATQTSGMFATAMPTAPGTYNYVCTIHQSIGMTGSVLVQ